MLTSTAEQPIHTLQETKDVRIAAPIEIVFATLLEHLGPLHETAPEYPLPMKLEPWPGGRWYRDLGNNTGHFWGHVQVMARFTADGETIEAGPGDILIVGPQTPHKFKNIGTGRLDIICIHSSPRMIQEELEETSL